MRFKTPLQRRQKEAARLKHRYATDPEYRLHKVNQVRRSKGIPLATHVDEIMSAQAVWRLMLDRRGLRCSG